MTYVVGFLTPVPAANKERYIKVKLEEGEQVVFSWITWPDKASADAAWEKMQNDPAMQHMDMPFDGKRMIWGGFETVFEI